MGSVYMVNGKYTMNALHCTEASDGSLRLNVEPNIACWHDQHLWIAAAAIVGLCVYMVGYPLFIARALWMT